MNFNFFIELTGENSKNRLRTKKLIEELNKLNKQDLENSKVIISGKSSFNFFEYDWNGHKYIKKLILSNSNYEYDKKIIDEMESMDTYGNIYFSIRKITKEIFKLKEKNRKFDKIKINIITEKFHNKRVRIILSHFESFFKTNLYEYKIEFNLISSKNGEGIFSIFKYKITSLANILDAFLIEIRNILNIKNFEKYELFELYLFSIPPYSLFYHLNIEDEILLKIQEEYFLKHNSYEKLVRVVKKKFTLKEENLKYIKDKIKKKYKIIPLKKFKENPLKDFKTTPKI